MTLPSHISLFDAMRAIAKDRVPILQCSKVTLVHLSHTLEDIVLKNQMPATMFTGFQESSHWLKETQRYHALTTVAKQVCIFAGKPLAPDSVLNALQIELSEEDPLHQEWFVLILSADFNVLLTGKDHAEPDELSPYQSWRKFATILTFDPEIIAEASARLLEITAHYRPQHVPELEASIAQHAPFLTSPQHFTSVIEEFIQFEERLNEQLRYEDQRNRQIVETMQAYTLTLDGDGIIQSVNPALMTVTGHNWQELIERDFTQYIGENGQSQLMYWIEQVLTTGQPQTFTATLVGADGSVHHVDWNLSLLRMADDEQLVMALGHDVTTRVNLENARVEEAKLRAILRNERELGQIRLQFITTVSHEFRTPLTSILNSAEMLEKHHDRLGEEGRQRRLNRIKDQVLLLTQMVEDISLVLSASEGSLQLMPARFRVNELTQDIINGVKTHEENNSPIVFNSQIVDDYLVLDNHLLRFILSNIVENAVKYSPPQAPVYVNLTQENERLIYEIIDQGAGIQEDERSHIFKPFYRGSSAGNTPGTGMGLRIVRDCIAIYGGTVQFRSDDNGTTFVVRLPIPPLIAEHSKSSN
ncbi:MAG: ATP-binding protein [Anaerolineae bacterium]